MLAVYSFSLPGCPVDRNVKSQSWIDTLGLRAAFQGEAYGRLLPSRCCSRCR
ncbi:MAG: hypothetical protein ACLRMJ_08095 [Alistipes finegoldii]